MNPSTDIDLTAAVAAEFLGLADLLEGSSDGSWDAPSLCVGWRVREVVAHVTMAVRYGPDEFMAELGSFGGDFTRLSNAVASRDAELPTDVLLSNLRDDGLHRWTPPGGGPIAALEHVVIHGFDITMPLGVPRRTPDATVRVVLDDLTNGGTCAHFGFALGDRSLRASDMDWSYGSGPPIVAPAAELVVTLSGRLLSSPAPRGGAVSG